MRAFVLPAALATIAACSGTPPGRASSESGLATQTSQFRVVGSYRSLGSNFGGIVAPGAAPGSELVYASFLYAYLGLDVVAIDPDTGASVTFANPAAGEYGARAMVRGPDENIYLGTLPNAHFLELVTREGRLIDLGRPSATEEFIWDLAVGSDQRIYGGTSPNAKLVRLDPATGALEDLGRMDPSEVYVRHVAASDDGFVYAAVGASHMNVVAFEIATGRHRSILPPELQVPGFAEVYKAADSKIHVRAGDQYFEARGWLLASTAPNRAGTRALQNRTRDGRAHALQGPTLVSTRTSGSVTRTSFDYSGNNVAVFRLGLGPDDAIYGSSVMPAHLLRLDEAERRIEDLGDLGGGEVYSFVAHGDALMMAGYATHAPLMAFDPRKRFQHGVNPVLVHYRGEDPGWRPLAMLDGRDHTLHVGAIAGYGKLDGSLCEWTPSTESVGCITPIPRQSVSALALLKNLVVVGTSGPGGGGSHAVQSEAKVLLWDPRVDRVLATTDIPGSARIDNLATSPGGDIYVIAQHTLFVLDGRSLEIKHRAPLPFAGDTLWNSLAYGPHGKLWGAASDGIFTITPDSHEVTMDARPPQTNTAGFAVRGDHLFFASGSDVYRFSP